jgi:cell division protein FtsZ
MSFDCIQDREKEHIIKIVAVGKSGIRAINKMVKRGFGNVGFVVVDRDESTLETSKASINIRLLENTDSIDKDAFEEGYKQIKKVLAGSRMVIILAGMGEKTGTFDSAKIAQIARHNIGALTIAIVTKPFAFEDKERANVAVKILEQLADSTIVFPCEKLIQYMPENITREDQFSFVDDILLKTANGIIDMILATSA